MKLRKALVTMTALTMLFGAAGCKKTSESSAPNENRSTNHEYDFVDYIDIKAYGPDGKELLKSRRKAIPLRISITNRNTSRLSR